MNSPDIGENSIGQTEERLAEAKKAAGKLNALFGQVFNEWAESFGEVRVPERLVEEYGEVLFANSVFDSQPKRITSLALQKAIEEGEVMIAVTAAPMTPIFKVNRVESIKTPKDDQRRVVLALFPHNFFGRCLVDGLETKRVVEDSLACILYWDAKLDSDKTPRLKVNPPKKHSFVRVYKST